MKEWRPEVKLRMLYAAGALALTGLFGGVFALTSGLVPLGGLADWLGLKRPGSKGAIDWKASGEGGLRGAEENAAEKERLASNRSKNERLPAGFEHIDGMAGEGIHRMIRSHGVWFPVYSPGESKDGVDTPEEDAALAMYPVMIASGTPPKGTVGQPYAFDFEAVGGVPPYSWAMRLEDTAADLFALDARTGSFNGVSAEPVTTRLVVAVRDSVGDWDDASYTLAIAPENALEITTTALEPASVGAPYSAALTASGGVNPYSWSITSGALPQGLALDAVSGALTGSTESAGEYDIEWTVADQQQTRAARRLMLRVVSGVEIVTESPLPPASPGLAYEARFEASGGTPPYMWRIQEGAPPVDDAGRAWTLSPEGLLAGTAGTAETIGRFAVEVEDSAQVTFRKEFQIAVRGGLIAVASREKAGLAWQPHEVARTLGTQVGGFVVTRSLAPDGGGAMVFQGTANNFVDRGLATGGTYFYTLYAVTPGGQVRVTTKAVTILPISKQRAAQGEAGDPFADAVRYFRPLTPGGHGAGFLPLNVTGPPDGKGTFYPASLESEVVSLHARAGNPGDALAARGGEIVLEFTNNIVDLAPGVDFTVFENVIYVGNIPSVRFMEPAIVWVALFEGEWHRFPIDVIPPAPGKTVNTMNPFYYAKGFAGVNGTIGGDPTNPAGSGGDGFDVDALGNLGLTWIRYIKLQSPGDNVVLDDFGGDPVRHNNLQPYNALSGSGASGFDLDAVSAVNY